MRIIVGLPRNANEARAKNRVRAQRASRIFYTMQNNEMRAMLSLRTDCYRGRLRPISIITGRFAFDRF